MIFSPQKQKFVDAATDMFGGGAVLNKQNVRDASAKAGVPKAGWFMKSSTNKMANRPVLNKFVGMIA